MRKIVAGFAASLDGYIEGKGGAIDCIVIDKEMDFAGQWKHFDAFLFGRKTYEMAQTMGGKPAQGIINYVISNTLTHVAKNYTLLQGDVKARLQQLKQQDGKDIAVFGGAILLASLLDLQLVDEIVVSVIPVLLGSGKPMVAALHKNVWLKHQESKTYPNGTVQLTYKVVYNRA